MRVLEWVFPVLILCGSFAVWIVLDSSLPASEEQQSKFKEESDRLIALGDRLRAEWHECDDDLAAVGIWDRVEATATAFVFHHGYDPIRDVWLSRPLRRVITHGEVYGAAIEKVMSSKLVAHRNL